MRLRRSKGSVLGPLLFTAYTAPVSDLIESFGVCCHQFADDTQLFIAMNVADTAPALDRLTRCTAAVRQWSLQNDLQLNVGKSEVILLCTAVQLRSAADITTIDIAGSPLPRSLRSSDAPLLNEPRTQTALAARAFSVAAPTVWDGLPSNVRSCDWLFTYRRHLKTHYFTAAYA